MSFFSGCPLGIFLVFGFQQFDYDVVSFGIILLGFTELLESVVNMGSFQPLFLQIFLPHQTLLLSFWDSDDTDVRLFVTVPQVPKTVLLFFSLFSLCCLCNFCSFVFQLTDSFHCSHLSAF